MCGRYTQKASWEKVKSEFKIGRLNNSLQPARYNIAPSQMIDVVRESEGETELTQFKWGLVPNWAKEAGSGIINARAETLEEKPSFRYAFEKRRCIIPASGFYEWKKSAKGKQPFYFIVKEKDVFGFAGLWEEWLDKESGELLETCTIITTEANEVLKPVHHRMPVILKPDKYELWLDTNLTDTEILQDFLKPYPSKEMDSYPVGTQVNNPEYDAPELILNSK